MQSEISRRQLVRNSGLIAVGLVAPKWLSNLAHADVVRQAKGLKPSDDTVFVVCQLTGGNDGLNTVIPYADSLYYQYRPSLSIKEDAALKLNEKLALHPSLSGLHALYQQGQVAIIQNVGYPKPNRSHFKSMEIWQSASPESTLKHGWIGRHLDASPGQSAQNPVMAIGMSVEKPLALNGAVASIPCFASLADVRSMIGDGDAERMLRDIQSADSRKTAGNKVVKDANRAALDAISTLSAQLDRYTPKGAYREDEFGQGFKQIAQLVVSSPKTRIVYFSAGGFDTHARQATTHERLLKNFGDAVQTFQNEMVESGRADKVIVLVFSEFGRRVMENASAGTDHGHGAPMFVIGKQVKGGLYGPIPNLSDLHDGDLRMAIDFRQVYATALDSWLGGDSEVVLGQSFAPLPIFR
jgi:uncharacterized protein (DUF1501 family)